PFVILLFLQGAGQIAMNPGRVRVALQSLLIPSNRLGQATFLLESLAHVAVGECEVRVETQGSVITRLGLRELALFPQYVSQVVLRLGQSGTKPNRLPAMGQGVGVIVQFQKKLAEIA